MIDYIAVVSRGGFVLWKYETDAEERQLEAKVNNVLRTALVQGRFNANGASQEDDFSFHLELDNEHNLVFLAGHQTITQPAYVRDLLTALRQKFLAAYRRELDEPAGLCTLCAADHFRKMDGVCEALLQRFTCDEGRAAPKVMRRFEESDKSKKTVGAFAESMMKNATAHKASKIPVIAKEEEPRPEAPVQALDGTGDAADIMKSRQNFMRRLQNCKEKKAKPNPVKGKVRRVKENRCWEGADPGADPKQLDFSNVNGTSSLDTNNTELITNERHFIGMMKGELEGIKEDSVDDDNVDEDFTEEDSSIDIVVKRSSGRSFFAAFQSLVGSKVLNQEVLRAPLEKMKEHLISKNVAAEVAEKLCESVGVKLEGKVVGHFSTITAVVKDALRECLSQLLMPKHRINMLRDIMHAKEQKRCYSVVFCGVNGVGKSTNLAKIAFWLNENGFKVLIAACDTFRAGAVEQLRTHVRHLAALHSGYIELYERGYGKDAASVAASAIGFAVSSQYDVVLIDTAGRMQDNEPLMRSLAKLIHVNAPDLVLFVGEALVGNEAIDQLQKFNQALADHAACLDQVRLLDGIMLTKFDTIDDKVGAAISMTYITGKPIVFVGTGQTYKDLKVLDSDVIVSALLR